MIFQKFLNSFSILTLLLVSNVGAKKSVEQANQEEAEMSNCLAAHSRLNENIELQEDFAEMLVAYNETCREKQVCVIDIQEDTLKEMQDKDSDIIPSIKGTAVAHFGEDFKDHDAFQHYAVACSDAGGHMECVDGHFIFFGDSTAAVFKQEESVETDVEIDILSYPICLPTQCDGEPLDEVFEYAAKKAILKMPMIVENMSAKSEALIMAASMEQVCILSGLDTCYLEVTHAPCEINEIAGRKLRY